MKKEYTILTTYPKHQSGNVGDKLITHSAKDMISAIKGKADFISFFRGKDLTNQIDRINKTDAIIMPGCATRYNMYPGMYKLVDDLDKLQPPLIPLGSSWSNFPGDYIDCKNLSFSKKTKRFLKYLSTQSKYFACRDYYTCNILENNGIDNTLMTGDCAWYDLDSIGKNMKRSNKINKLVFTTPHNSLYTSQAKNIVKMLKDLFPDAEKYCSFHSVLDEKDKEIKEYARKNDFIIKKTSHEVDKLSFYEDCDLHVGYRLHGNIAFLRKRIPSVLLNEDGRGVAFSYTIGIDGFNAFYRWIPNRLYDIIKRLENRYIHFKGGYLIKEISDKIVAKANPLVVEEIKRFLEEEKKNDFRRFRKISDYIDDTYNNKMKPFIEEMP